MWRVPLTAFGDLRIVASARIKGAGPFTSQPVVFHWPWYWHLLRLGPWALLALAVAVPKRNRDRRTLLIFVPLAILSLLWPVATRPVGFASVSLDRFSLLFESLVVGLALLWLYVINLPYMLLMFRSPFFRPRFRTWLGARSSGIATPLP